MSRLTKKRIELLNEMMNRAFDRPLTAWRREGDHGSEGPLRANIGHLFIHHYAPGDGWTRYGVRQMSNELGGESVLREGMRNTELEAFIDGLMHARRMLKGE